MVHINIDVIVWAQPRPTSRPAGRTCASKIM